MVAGGEACVLKLKPGREVILPLPDIDGDGKPEEAVIRATEEFLRVPTCSDPSLMAAARIHCADEAEALMHKLAETHNGGWWCRFLRWNCIHATSPTELVTRLTDSYPSELLAILHQFAACEAAVAACTGVSLIIVRTTSTDIRLSSGNPLRESLLVTADGYKITHGMKVTFMHEGAPRVGTVEEVVVFDVVCDEVMPESL